MVILRSLLLILLFTNMSFALTKAQILNRVRTDINDRIENNIKHKWTDDRLLSIINEAQRSICDTTWCLYASTRITMVTGTTYYSMPSDCYAISRVLMNLKEVVEETTIPTLDRDDTYWMTKSTGEPQYYFWKYDKKQIGFTPCPKTTYAMDIDYTKIPIDLVNDSDVPFNSVDKYTAYHDLIVFYTVAYCLSVDGKPNATIFWTLWSNGVSAMANKIGVTPNPTYIPFMGGMDGRR